MVIKPSGVGYDELVERSMVVCDLDGVPVAGWNDGALRPSSDTASHAYVYRHMPGVGGVVHTHSAYATAWAACGMPIPCVLTAMADEFGGDIPVGPFARDRWRRDRQGCRGDLVAAPLPGRPDGQPRGLRDRTDCPRRGEGRGDVRGRGPNRVSSPPARRSPSPDRRLRSTRCTIATCRSTARSHARRSLIGCPRSVHPRSPDPGPTERRGGRTCSPRRGRPATPLENENGQVRVSCQDLLAG